MPGTFQLWNGMFLLSDSGLLAIHPDCCCEDTAGTTRCCGGSDLSTRVRITAEGFSNNNCDDCSDLDGVYDTDFLFSRTQYIISDYYGDWPNYEWYWLGGTFASPCWEDDLVWLACFQEVHHRTFGSFTCEGGICHNDAPRCHVHSWLTTPEQADTIAGGGDKTLLYWFPHFYWGIHTIEDELPFCQGSQQSLPSMGYWAIQCFAPPPGGVWIEQL